VSEPSVREPGVSEPGASEPVVRAVRDSDSAALIALIAGCFAEYTGCVLDVATEETWLREPATAYARAGGVMWVVTQGGAVVACIGNKPAGPGERELKSLYVAASARRHGLGSRLVRLVEGAARELGATTVVMWSDTRFTDAHRLYRRLGYDQPGSTRELHDLSGTIEYFFSKALADTPSAARGTVGEAE